MAFQSTPAITGGRCGATATHLTGTAGFNPRPPLLAGDAANMARSSGRRPTLFQSTPAITGGRCASRSRSSTAAASFNPRPPLLAGDANIVCNVGMTDTVSIHARHYWRAMPTDTQPLAPTDAVSIHARHYWRAMRLLNSQPSMEAIVSIHARHYWRAMQGTTAP